MAAPTLDNVISFPDAGRGSAVPDDKLLAEARDLAARRLRESLRGIVEKVSEALQQRGDVAVDRDQRSFLHGLRDALDQHAGRFEAQIASHWIREFDAARIARKPKAKDEMRLEDLQIVDDGDLSEQLALKSLSGKLGDSCEDELYAVGRRLGALAGKTEPDEEGNPAGPDVFCRALQEALRDVDLEIQQRMELYRCFEPHLAERITGLYHEMNTLLVRHNVLPALRRGYGRTAGSTRAADKTGTAPDGDIFSMLQKLVAAPGSTGSGSAGSGGVPGAGAAAGGGGLSAPTSGASQALAIDRVLASLDALQRSLPAALPAGDASTFATVPVGTNVLHEFRASEVGQGLTQLDAITVDIVSMLFDLIFDDREIADPIKALVGRLQIPVLKVAMLDKSFFSSRAHPTRRLLDVISRAAVRWGREVGRDDPIYWKIAQIIARLHDEFVQDTSLFDSLCTELEAFLADQEDAADVQAARAVPLVERREQEELSALAVDEILKPWLTGVIPLAVSDLLHHEWRQLLLLVRRESGGAGLAWDTAVQTANDLVASVQNKPDVQERRALSRQLPYLVKQISSGFDRLGVPAERRKALLDALFTIHASVMRDAAPLPSGERFETPVATAAVPQLATVEVVEGDVQLESISLLDAIDVASRSDSSVEDLRRGDWVEFQQPAGEPIRYRLSWISPQRGIYLFTNPQARALSVSPDALAVKLDRGEARIIPVEPIFERAVTRALESMQAA